MSKHDVGVARHAAGEAERHDRQRRRVARPMPKRSRICCWSALGVGVGRVDDMVGPAPQRRHQLALARRCRRSPGGRGRADGAAASRNSGGAARRPAQSREQRLDREIVLAWPSVLICSTIRSASKSRVRLSMPMRERPAALGAPPVPAGSTSRCSSSDERQVVDHLPAEILERAAARSTCRRRTGR